MLGCHSAAEVSAFNPETYIGVRNLRALDRIGQFTASAAALTINHAGWSTSEQTCLGLVLGTVFSGAHTISEFDRRALVAGPACASPLDFANTVINAPAGQTAIRHGLRGVNSTVCAGTQSALAAISYAHRLIQDKRCDALLTGGAEELSAEAFLAFYRAGMLCGSASNDSDLPIPFHPERNGFALGEGACIFFIEEAESARRRGVMPLAEISGCGSAFATSPSRPHQLAKATCAAMHEAFAQAGIHPSDIGFISAGANGSVQEDREEAEAIAKTFANPPRVPVTAIKSMLGESLGAGAAFQIADALATFRDGRLPGIFGLENVGGRPDLSGVISQTETIDAVYALILSTSWGGHCGALVLKRCGERA
jgi:3-oxoacyl-[acyl-carrier-protein] synthase II